MKKLVTSFLFAMCGGVLHAQPVVDIRLVQNEADSVLEFYVRPHADFDAVVSGLSFTLRWPEASQEGIGTRQQYCAAAFAISPTMIVLDTFYYSRTYSAFGSALLSDEGCPWSACEEHLIMTIPVIVNGGFGPFEIVADTYFISLNGSEVTGAVDPSEPCLSTGMGNAPCDKVKGLSLFPNPATSELSIALPVGQQISSIIDVIATDGRITRLLNGRDGNFDVRSLAPGAYAVRTTGGSGRFVKQ